MKVLYVAPRFHTNQIPIMNGFIMAGDEVKFISQYQGGTEDYAVIKPIILGYSTLFSFMLKSVNILKKWLGRYRENDFDFQAKFGFLPKKKFISILEEMQPDIVILRDRSVYNIAITQICWKRKIDCILYTQTPYLKNWKKENNPIKRYFRDHTPGVEITPVYGKNEDKSCLKENRYYVPFVIDPYCSFEEKKYFQFDKINVLGVGKFEPRKHHEMLIRIARDFSQIPLTVTIVGEDVTTEEHSYLQKLKEEVTRKGLEERVNFRSNLTRAEIFKEYEKADIFALPSTGEFASISQLEAMSVSLPVICSDTNGTSCYIEEGINGYLFRDNDYDDFKNKIQLLLCDRGRIKDMGKESYKLVKEKYSFESYKRNLLEIQKKIGGNK